MTNLTVHQLHFTVQADTTIQLDTFKGSALRGAWQSHLRSLYCAERDNHDPLHQNLCPVCYLLSRETGTGNIRRPYSFIPPITGQNTFNPGDRFNFAVNIFGDAERFIPYIVLAVGQMGQHQGVGKKIHRTKPTHKRGKPRWERGKFSLVSIDAANPITGHTQTVLAEDASMVEHPAIPVTHTQIVARSAEAVPADGRVTLNFLTPTRIIHNKKLMHHPEFAPLFSRILSRVTALGQQYADDAPLDKDTYTRLVSLAETVALQNDATRWWDVSGHSTRLHREQKMGGFIGAATYRAAPDVWTVLFPWLVWGSVLQVGKNAVKGEGVFSVSIVRDLEELNYRMAGKFSE